MSRPPPHSRATPSAPRPTPAAGALELDAFLPYRLSVLSNTISGAIAEVYQQRFGLSIPEWRVMAILGRYPGLSAAEVAARTAQDKVAVSRAVSRLIAAGRVQRRFADADRRRSILELSAAGQAVYEEVVPQALALERSLLEALTASELEQLDTLLDTLLERARHLSTSELP